MNIISSKMGFKSLISPSTIALFTRKFTSKSVLILKEYPKTVANLNITEFLCFKIIFSASTFVLP